MKVDSETASFVVMGAVPVSPSFRSHGRRKRQSGCWVVVLGGVEAKA